ncbi:MAG TPA: LLM class flavin-dependent oxidoreductase [Thermomicrobiaceae bacterium]|nr:LLM class flavin-dependent oxidoreductase [Thermomicrobiaceae bacterium]
MASAHVRYGLYLPPFGPLADPAVLLDLARRAEAAGWDGVFLWEHVLSDGPGPVTDPWVNLGAMAAATSRVRLGTMVTPLPRRRPWVVARQAATVSRLSGGRCVLGVGLGADEYGDFSRFGETASPRTRAAMTDEALAIVRASWAGQALDHAGDHYRVRLEPAEPEPYPIPIWAAGTLPEVRALPRAAGCDGIVLLKPDRHPLPADVARTVAALRARDVAADRPFDVAVAGNASPAWEEPSGIDLDGLAEAGMTWWLETLIHYDPLELSLRVVDAGPPRGRG